MSTLDLAEAEWTAFKNEHGKKYNSEAEEKDRRKIFMENKEKIAEHNRKYASGDVSYTQKINKFADLTHHEFLNTFTGSKKSSEKP